jgi:O-antigen/teichoic acid export membrane protein
MNIFRKEIFSKNAILTVFSKSVILIVNFLIVVVTTRLWGTGGRGEIALILSNIAIISILNNITCGSTIVFHAQKEYRENLLIISIFGALAFSFFGAVVFSLTIGFMYFPYLFVISFLSSLTNSFALYWLGKGQIRLYNLLTTINPVLILVYILLLYFVIGIADIRAVFYGYYAGLGTSLVICVISLVGSAPVKLQRLDTNILMKIVRYGFKNEFNNFIQFLNYRLSYFFIAKWLGLSLLGVFSVAISCAEGVWVISRSMSAIHFSNVVNTQDRKTSIDATRNLARQTFWISLTLLGILTLMPASLFEFVFGDGFGNIRMYVIYLIPGIIAIAVANLYDNYFTGVGKLNILIMKSFYGLIATIFLLVLLTKSLQLNGVCISLNISYILSFSYLYYRFWTERKRSILPVV